MVQEVRMNQVAWVLSFLLLAYSVPASADDRQKAEKQVRKIAAMATDKIGRRMVSMSMADSFRVPRPVMVEQRRKVGLDYGSFFVAHELIASGVAMADIMSELSTGKTIWQIAVENRANWKQIEADAKKQNNKIEDYIYRHFVNKKNDDADEQRDLAEKYDLARDAVRTDFNVTPEEMVEAQTRYIFWRDEAGKSQGPGRNLTDREKKAASMDHADSRHDTNGGIAAPAAGGLPPQ
jgi:hypothetical protein